MSAAGGPAGGHGGVVWTVLGAGAILPRAGYGCSGYALRPAGGHPITLFDCGPGTLRSLGEVGLELGDVRRVILSHYHPDHCLDLCALAFARRNPAFDAPPLELVGPHGLATFLERAGDVYGDRGWLRFEDTTVREVDPGEPGTLSFPDVSVSWTPTGHTPEAVAWRAELGGVSVAYTGDSGENPSVTALARDVDLLVAECSFPDELGTPNHLTPSGAGRLARDAGCKRLLLTHFYPVMDPEEARTVCAEIYSGTIEVASDGSSYRVG
jgi:ribonuclease BN (tRNA processing enzyme)